MGSMFIGLGTLTNVVAVLLGASVGLVLGDRLPQRARTMLTDIMGLVTVVLGVSQALTMGSQNLAAVVGGGAMLVVLGSLIVGGLLGTWWRLEDRFEAAADGIRRRVAPAGDAGRFVDAIVVPTLLFCVGPLTILGSLSDGLGRGADQLLVKSVLDGFAAIAFASSLGWGVLFSAAAVGIIQGSLTLAGFLLGDVISLPQIDALTATGGVMLLGLGLRLLNLREIPVANLLPALAVAPLLVGGVALLA